MDSNETKNYVLIEYPGVIKNIDKAIETLGGLSAISSSYNSGRALELKYRPENLYQNGLQAERKNLSDVISGKLHLVVKIRRKKGNPTDVKTTCLGMVSTIYSFKNICDFQYLPLEKKEYLEDLVPRVIPTDLASALSWWDSNNDEPNDIPNFLPPFLFSRYNTPSTKILCNEVDRNMDVKNVSGFGKNLRLERKALTVTVKKASDPFPIAPSEEAVNDANFRCKNEEPHRLLFNLFAERPMWTRVAITYKTGLEENLLKILLAKFAFYIASGPWGRLWCRFGYDPRTDPTSMQFQTVMVTFRQHASIPERQRLKVSGSDRGNVPTLLSKDVSLIDFTYKSGVLPAVRQMWYSVCDIELSEAQKILQPEYTMNVKKYDEIHGWLPPDAINEIRKAIKQDVSKVSAQIETEIIENSALDDSVVNSEEEWND